MSAAVEKLAVSDREAARLTPRRRQVLEAEVRLEMLPGEDGAGDGVVGHGERRGRRAVDADHDLVVPDNEAVE